MNTSTPVMYLLVSMHACWKKSTIFPNFEFWNFHAVPKKNWSEIPEFTKGGNPYKMGRKSLPQQLIIAYKRVCIWSGSALDLLLEHFSGFLSYIFLRWTLCIQKPLFHWKIDCSSQPSICHWLSSSIFPCSFVRWHQTKSPFCFNIYRHKSPSLTQYH